MAEWRTSTTLIDNSQTISTSADTAGYTVIKAQKGINDFPYYFDPGSSQKILDTFGYPKTSESSVAIQDVLNYNKSYGIYCMAPFDSASGIHGAVLVTKSGTIGLVSGLETAEISDFSDIEQTESVGTGDGSTTTFNLTTTLFDYYKDMSIDILVDGVSQEVTATDTEPEVLSTTGGDSGSFTRSTGVLAYTFATAPDEDAVITVQYSIDVSEDCYFALISKGAQADDLAVIVEDYNSAGQFTVNMYRQDVDDATEYNETPDSPYTISVIEGDKDGFGNGVYIDTIFDPDDDWYIVPAVNLTAFDTFVDDTDYVDFAGGERGDDISASDIVEGFDFLTDADTYDDVAIVFDTTGYETVVTEFETLRGTDASPGEQYRTKFLVPCAKQSVSDILDDTATAKRNVEQRGINFVANSWCKHTDLYNDTPFICSGMGQVAKRYADSRSVSYGALSPMYLDENGVGGQLGSGVLELSNTASETQLKKLNTAGIIGIKKISGSGFTIVGDRTSQSTTLSDYSYTIHSDLADYILKNIEEQVLPQQIGKSNDALHRANVASKAELIMSGIAQYLDDYEVKCDTENNTDDIRAQRKFILTIGVIFTPNSQTINFVFVNSRVGTDISQVISKS